jgi:shikimate kinase
VSIVLVGMPGCGKSTVGRHLARQFGYRFTDSDSDIEARLGHSIREHFERHGETSFRDLEQTVIGELSGEGRVVLATGGGAVLREANRSALRRGGNRVVYLRSSPEELARRLRHDTQRPLLQGGDALKKLRDLFRVRDPLYCEVAHYVIDAGRTSLPTLVNLVAMQLDLGSPLAESGEDLSMQSGDA